MALAVPVAAMVLVAAPASRAWKSQPADPPAGTSTRLAAISAKVDALIGQMTLEEKFGQLEMSGPPEWFGAPWQTLLDAVRQGQVGSVTGLVGVNRINEVQQAALQSRLHIPAIFALDVIHGYKTIFPVPIGEASSWDPAAAGNDESVSAAEATADGLKLTFNPMVDISRDPRWGRVTEGAGEDPYLGSAIAAAKVRGYQGSDFSAPDKMATTVKHFAGYGAPAGGRDYNTADMSEQQLRNDYLPPYKAAIDAGAASVMSAYHSLNGVPASANPYLLNMILRAEWKFGGPVMSDYQAIARLINFGFAPNGEEAARLALTAGVDIEMGVQVPGPNATYPANGPALVRSGLVSMAQIDNDVRRVLTLKYLAGLFDAPYTDPTRVQHEELTPAHLDAARAMADRSMVLLRNQDNALPLNPAASSVAVIGPLADDPANQLGPHVPIGYSPSDQSSVVTVLNGIKAALPHAAVSYAQGCDAFCTSEFGFRNAVRVANASDVTVVVVGEPAEYSGEDHSRSELGLPGKQLALVQAIAATGKPYVVVLMNGRPLAIDWLADNAPAILESWFPGTEGGNAVADVLFGKVSPGGKLPMSFPRNTGQIPISYNELPTGLPARYLDVPRTPLYPFGYGLSYTTFALSNLHLSASSIPTTGKLTVTADITNTGTTAGDDVVQLYIHQSGTSILQPVRRLEGFQRVTLAPGQAQTVTFPLEPSNIGFYNNQGQFVVEPGSVDVYVGDSSEGGLHGQFTVG